MLANKQKNKKMGDWLVVASFVFFLLVINSGLGVCFLKEGFEFSIALSLMIFDIFFTFMVVQAIRIKIFNH